MQLLDTMPKLYMQYNLELIIFRNSLILFIPTGCDLNHFVDFLPKAVLEEL